MRLLADENLSPRTVQWLREQGHDVFDIKEEGLQGLDDESIFDLAMVLEAVIVTKDLDFGRIQRFARRPHNGILLLRPGHFQSAEVVNSLLARFFAFYPQVDMRNRVAVITPRHIRFRPPLQK